MEHLSKALGTVFLWGGAALLAHVFDKAGLLSGGGAAWMTAGTLFVTCAIWTHDRM